MADYEITANLDAPLAQFQQAIHSTTRLVAVGLNSLEVLDATNFELPVFFKFSFSGFPSISPEEMKAQYRLWQLQNGFRDCIEATNLFLDEAMKLYGLFSIGRKNISGEQFNELMQAAKKFHRSGLPDKLETLEKRYSARLNPDHKQMICSINSARNCLVHRAGVVGDMDLNTQPHLSVKWSRMTLVVSGTSGEREIRKPNELIQAGEGLKMGRAVSEKRFTKGENIRVLAEEFNEICGFLHLFGVEISQDIKDRAKAFNESNGPCASS